MAYQVLARKYRPQRFSDVIGQDHVTQTLLNALAQDRIAHGYIFSGHRGIGKTTIARILAMALECRTPQGTPERPTPEPCGVCDACVEIRAGNAMDVIEIDAATNRGIDEIRELREGARYSPARDRYKIYILDEAHQITDAAFNALLKTLEEPPAHVIFMMATTQPEDIPQTIRSRCQHFSFHAVRFQEIVAQLRSIAGLESIGAEEEALSLLAEAGDGSMRDALSIMDQAIASAPSVEDRRVLDAAQIRSLMGTVSNQVFEHMMDAVEEHNPAAMLEQAARLLDAGNSPQQIARQMVRFLRNCLMARLAGEKSELLQVSDEESARAARVAAKFSEEDLTRFLNSMLRTFDDLGYRQEQRFHLELGLLKLVHMQRLLPFEELFRQISGGAGSTGSTGTPNPRLANGNTSPAKATPTMKPVLESVAPIAAVLSAKASEAAAHPLDGVFGGGFKNVTVKLAATVPAPTPPPVPVSAPASRIVHSTEAKVDPKPTAEPDTAGPASAQIPTSKAETDLAGSAGTALREHAPEANVAAAQTVDAEALRAEICDALIRGGHETAGSLFEAGKWDWDGQELRVGIGASKTMLDMVYTTQAQQIVRENFRRLTGSGQKVKVESDAASAGAGGQAAARQTTRLPMDAGEPGIRPQDHPLIRQAQELFRAEIRSVVSLRDPH